MALASEALRRLKPRIGSRIGVLGGTFDPVHNGHLAAAGAVREGLVLDTILFVPAALPPHKSGSPVSPFADRAAMLELAVAGRPEFVVTRLEAERPGPSYSVDTLRQLHRLWDHEKKLFFIVGMDAFVKIDTWKEYRELPRLAELVVLDRPGLGAGQLEHAIDRFFPGFRFDPREKSWMEPETGGRILPFALKPTPVSSTLVRRLASEDRAVAELVPEAVARYLREHHLYQSAGIEC